MAKGSKGPDFYDDPNNSVGYLARVASRGFSRALEKRTLPKGVTIGQWRFLRVLWMEDGLTQRELSRRVGLREPTTVTSLKSLERSELVTRKQSEEDRRRIHVYLTPKARRLRRVLMPYVGEVNRLATAGVSDTELALFLSVLMRIHENLAAHNGEATAVESENRF